MATPVIREAVRDFMSDQFHKHGTTEFTAGEITRGLEAEGYSFGNKQVTNALQSLKALNKVVQTRKAPGQPGGAMYWALVSVLEAATAPEKPAPEKSANEAAPTPEGTEMATPEIASQRKPRHDDPAHFEHALVKALNEFEVRITKQFAVMQTDFEQAVKSKMTAIAETIPSAAPSANVELDWEKLNSVISEALKKVSNDDVVSLMDVGAKISEESAKNMATLIELAQGYSRAYSDTSDLMRRVLRECASQDEVKEVGFAKGFEAGWRAAADAFNSGTKEALMEAIRRQATGGNAALTTEKPKDVPDTPLNEALRKLGAFS